MEAKVGRMLGRKSSKGEEVVRRRVTRGRWWRVVKAVTWAYIGGYRVLRRLTVVRVMGGDTRAMELTGREERRGERNSLCLPQIPKVTEQLPVRRRGFVILARGS